MMENRAAEKEERKRQEEDEHNRRFAEIVEDTKEQTRSRDDFDTLREMF
jgi:hypothetical protein